MTTITDRLTRDDFRELLKKYDLVGDEEKWGPLVDAGLSRATTEAQFKAKQAKAKKEEEDLSNLEGLTIKKVRWMTKAELKAEGWDYSPQKVVCLVLSNGTKIFPSADEEGNNGGAIFGKDKNGNGFYVFGPRGK